jgi:hypothetical protein
MALRSARKRSVSCQRAATVLMVAQVAVPAAVVGSAVVTPAVLRLTAAADVTAPKRCSSTRSTGYAAQALGGIPVDGQII